jgi:3'-5' exoribonuclease
MDLSRDDHPYISELEVGDSFDGYYVLRTIQMATTRANKPYLTIDLTDRTGHVKAKLWDEAEVAYRILKVGEVVKIRAVANEYLGKTELKIDKIRVVSGEDIEDYSRFLPTSERDPKDDWLIIESAFQQIIHPGIENLLQNILNDEELCKLFERAPAGKKWHHGYIGGLLEHTASLIALVEKVCEQYPHLNRDILLAGAFFHDIGKIWELTYDTAIDYSIRGRLEGHITIGASFVDERCREIEDLDEETTTQIKHLILSHQGSRENGCPVEPMTREAFTLYFLDELDSKLNALEREYDKADGGGGSFTNYIPLLDRMLYKGE